MKKRKERKKEKKREKEKKRNDSFSKSEMQVCMTAMGYEYYQIMNLKTWL